MKLMARLNTLLESEGAEFLVLGKLLIEGIPSYKAYTKQSGYDLIAVSPEANRSARIQVKSRWATDAGDFLIRRFDCDFVVLVRLNRGNRYSKRNSGVPGTAEPDYFVLPVSIAKDMTSTTGWGKLKWNPGALEDHRGKWLAIRDFLKSPRLEVNQEQSVQALNLNKDRENE